MGHTEVADMTRDMQKFMKETYKEAGLVLGDFMKEYGLGMRLQ